MGKKQTIPNEPEEMPVTPQNPEIKQPNDPGVPKSPEEAPGTQPPEISPDRTQNPEINPGRIDR
jgi:hypothetical protein